MRSDSHKKENQVTTLFVNACMRGEASRTLALCREYLERFDDVVEVDVAALDLKPFAADRVAYRTEIFRFRLRLKRTLNMSACAS